MPLVAFDSNICIWCIKEECTPGQESEMMKAINLRKLLTDNGFDILIPTPVLSELLSNIPEVGKRMDFYNEIRKTFQIGEFDTKASLQLAEILHYHYLTSNKAYQNLGITKLPMKYDALIVAISKSAGAECLFAHDNDCEIIAANFFSVKSLDERPDSINTKFGLLEIRQDEDEIF
jgi:predicted nucleic acid-binding protein